MPLPKRWPYKAKQQRDQAAERVMDIIRFLTPLVENGYTLTETEELRRQARALSAAKSAAMWLMKAGAPIQPFENGPPMAMEDE